MLTVTSFINKSIFVLFCGLSLVSAGYSQPFFQRIIDASAQFLNVPYQFDPLEDELSSSCSPISASKPSFDCFSFVQTVLAQAHSDPTPNVLSELRYAKEPHHYFNRYHFTSVEWNPELIKKGFLRNITTSIKTKNGECFANSLSVKIDRNAFWHKKINNLKKSNHQCSKWLLKNRQNLPTLNAHTPYIPKEKWLDHQHLNKQIIKQLPTVTLIEVVRKNWPKPDLLGTQLAVSHMGFLIHQGNQWIFRHASSQHQKVMDTPWEEYIKYTLDSKTIIGFATYEATEKKDRPMS